MRPRPGSRLTDEERARARSLFVEQKMTIHEVAEKIGRSHGAVEPIVRGLRGRGGSSPNLKRALAVVSAYERAKAGYGTVAGLVERFGYADRNSLSGSVAGYRQRLAARSAPTEEAA